MSFSPAHGKVYLIQLCVTKFVYELLYEVQYYINSTPIRSRLNVTLIYIRDRLGRERKVVLFTSTYAFGS